MVEPDRQLYGYFDASDQSAPAHDPGRGAVCPGCLKTLVDKPVRTHSLMVPGDGRSYFWRVHVECETEDVIDQVESALVDTRSTA